MHPVRQPLYHSMLLFHFVAPLHPAHLAFGVARNGPGAAMTHTGYENLPICDRRRLALGTFHDGNARATEATRARKNRLSA